MFLECLRMARLGGYGDLSRPLDPCFASLRFRSTRRWEGPDLTQLANRDRGDFLGDMCSEKRPTLAVVGEELWCDAGGTGSGTMDTARSIACLTSRRVNTCALQMHPDFFGHPTPNHDRPPGLSQSPRRSSLRACYAGPELSLSLPKRRSSHTEQRSRGFGKEELGNGKWRCTVRPPSATYETSR